MGGRKIENGKKNVQEQQSPISLHQLESDQQK